MRSISLVEYTVTVREQDALVPKPYNVRASLVELCFIPVEGVKGIELIRRSKLAEKIEASDEPLLLEEAEWQRLVDAIDKLPALGRNEVEIVRRVLEAPDVAVKPAS